MGCGVGGSTGGGLRCGGAKERNVCENDAARERAISMGHAAAEAASVAVSYLPTHKTRTSCLVYYRALAEWRWIFNDIAPAKCFKLASTSNITIGV